MLRSWKLGSVFGIGLYIHWSFVLLPAFVFLMVQREREPAVAFFAAGGVVSIFACILLHELGHALMARRFGIPTRDITLYPIGGVARLERMSEKPWEEFWIAIAGPAVNVVIVAVLVLFFYLGDVPLSVDRFDEIAKLQPQLFDYPLVPQMLIYLMMLNISLVVFNMIPAFPLDGGRVLRALLTAVLGHLRATEIAATLGMMLASGFILLGLIGMNPLLVMVALFAILAGQQELAMVRYRAAHGEEGHLPGPAHELNFIHPAAVPAEPNFSGFTWDGRARAWIEWRDGRPVVASYID